MSDNRYSVNYGPRPANAADFRNGAVVPPSLRNFHGFSAVFLPRRFSLADIRPVVHLAGAMLAARSARAFALSASLAALAAVSNRWHRG